MLVKASATDHTEIPAQKNMNNRHILTAVTTARHYRWESNRIRIQHAELEPYFWVKPN